MDYGKRISELLTATGLSRSVAARILGVTPQTLKNWIVGSGAPNLRQLERMRHVGVDAVSWFSATPPASPWLVPESVARRLIASASDPLKEVAA